MIENFGLIMFCAMIPIVIGVIVAIKNDKKKKQKADFAVGNTEVNWEKNNREELKLSQ